MGGVGGEVKSRRGERKGRPAEERSCEISSTLEQAACGGSGVPPIHGVWAPRAGLWAPLQLRMPGQRGLTQRPGRGEGSRRESPALCSSRPSLWHCYAGLLLETRLQARP